MKAPLLAKTLPSTEESAPRVVVLQPGTSVVLIAEATNAAPAVVPDDLIAFPFGLEARTAHALIRCGRLRAVRLGRRLYSKRSLVLALVDDEDAIAGAQSKAPVDEYEGVVGSVRSARVSRNLRA